MKKIQISKIISAIGSVVADRGEFLNHFNINKDLEIELSGTTKSYNYGEFCEIALKLALGLNAEKEQGCCADIVINGVGYDIKAIDSYASARQGHNKDTNTTIIIANYKAYQGIYTIGNQDIVYTKSGKIQRAETMAKAVRNEPLTTLLMGC